MTASLTNVLPQVQRRIHASGAAPTSTSFSSSRTRGRDGNLSPPSPSTSLATSPSTPCPPSTMAWTILSANQDLNGIVFTDAPWILAGYDPPKGRRRHPACGPLKGPVQRFRAMGIDSFRLYARLQQFNAAADIRYAARRYRHPQHG